MAWQSSSTSPSEPSDICSTCTQITFEMLYEGFEHELTYRQTIESGRRCSLCRLMVCSYARLQVPLNAYEANENYEILVPDLHLRRAIIRRQLPGARHGELGPIIEEFVDPPQHLSWARFSDSKYQRVNGCFSDGTTIQVSAPEDSKYLTNLMVELREISAANSERNTALLHGWLQDCIDGHTECRLTLSGSSLDDRNGSSLPTRIIDVGCSDSSTGPRLCENKSKKAQYVALSHRWGDLPKLRLTRDTLEAFKVSLPLERLPLTYKDAISVAKSLGIRYLWIDSLCIIQDDHDDWEREAGRMGDIFEQATLTIAAVDAIDDVTGEDRGLFMARRQDPLAVTLECEFDVDAEDPPPAQHPMWESRLRRLPFASDNPERRTIVLKPRWKGLWHTMEDTLWRRRAWVTQERTLSRRVVYYTKRKIFWDCKRMSSDEENRPNNLPPLRAQFSEAVRSADSSSSSLSSNHWTYSAWWDHIEEYSSCLLTKESDKLAACQGMCNRVESCIAAEIFAGTILDDAGINLLWRRSADAVDAAYTDFHAPTWSWLSIKGAVTYQDYTIQQEPQPQLSDFQLVRPSQCFLTGESRCRRGICGTISFCADFTILVAVETLQQLPSRKDSELIGILGSSVHYESKPLPRQVEPHILDIAGRKLSLPDSTQVLRTKGSHAIVGWILLDRLISPPTSKEITCVAISRRQATGRSLNLPHDVLIREFDYCHEVNIDFIAVEWDEGQKMHRRVGRGRVVSPALVGKWNRSRFRIY